MKTESIVIMIPARYGSTRFPGKPLKMIAGLSMLQRVHQIAVRAAKPFDNVSIYITTDDERVKSHALTFTEKVIMTPATCLTGSCRVYKACETLSPKPDIIVNLQGDLPLLPPDFIEEMIKVFASNDEIDVATPVTQLTWEALDKLYHWKEKHPFSGTTAVIDKEGKALWFSKNIIPAVRNVKALREASPLSPVYRHIGVYAYRYSALTQFMALDEGRYEKLEGLEQLRLLENGLTIQTVLVSYGDRPATSGVDTPADLKLAEDLLTNNKELVDA